MSHPRDPRHRRRDLSAAAVRLEVGADAMRAQQLDRGPEAFTARHFADALEPAPALSAAAGVYSDQLQEIAGELLAQAAEEEEAAAPPAPVAPLPPVTETPAPAPAPPVFSSEQPRVTDWVPAHDPRSLEYGIRPRLAGSAPMQDVLLPPGPIFDQGAEGSCFGMACTAAVNAMRGAGLLAPPSPLLDFAAALELYALAQRRDEIPGEGYAGTSVTGGMKAGREAGLFGGWLWSFGTRDIAQTLLAGRGAVIVGIPWLAGMYETGPGGLVQVTGANTGAGHCLAVIGIRGKGPQGQPGPYFVWQNSWGTGYGDGGLGYIHHRDLGGLLRGTGEAAIPTREPVR